VVVASGVSKSYAMTGWRVGWAIAPVPLAKAMAMYTGHTVSAPASFAQKAAVTALTGPQDFLGEWRGSFRERRDRALALAREVPGLAPFEPAGAFYLWIDVRDVLARARMKSADELAARLLDEARVALVPGSAFMADGWVRISFATSMERIEEGFARIRAFVGNLPG
jgi:aspartate aminotransferase